MKAAIFFVSLCIIGCDSEKNRQTPKPTESSSCDSKQVPIGFFKHVWKEYKREPIGKLNDTLPFPNCYLEIEGTSFRYILNGKLNYSDELTRDTAYKYLVFSFKNHGADKLHFLKADSSEIVLKRFANEGDYEYFRKE